MREIGGYIELDKAHGKEFHTKAVALSSGRHCLEYLIRAKNIEKLYIPYFLCSSVKDLCEKLRCRYEYYQIDADMRPVFEKRLGNNEYLYIVNYYGQTDNEQIRKYRRQYGNIIIDNAHAFFQRHIEGIATIYTCRKFFGVPDGGYLYTDILLDEPIECDVSFTGINYLLGRFEKDASSFYGEYQKHEHEFAAREMKSMSKLTHNLLRNIDYEFVSKARTDNFTYLNKKFGAINKLKLIIPGGAFMYPLYIDNGNELKKRLIQEKIYVPTLWGDVFDITEKDSREWDFADNIVPLPVDQRYDIDDMKYVCEIIERWKNEKNLDLRRCKCTGAADSSG